MTIGSIGFDANFSEDLDFDDYTGTLYFSGFDAGTGLSGMYTVNTDTGLATRIGPIGSDPAAISLDATPSTRLRCVFRDSRRIENLGLAD